MKFSEIAKENLKRELLKKFQQNLLIIKRELNNRKTNLNSAQLKIHQNFREKLKHKESLFTKATNNIDIFLNKIFLSIEESDLYKLIKDEDKNELYIEENFFCFYLFNDKGNKICQLNPNLSFEESLNCEENKFDFTCELRGETKFETEEREEIMIYNNKIDAIIYKIKLDINKIFKELSNDFSFININFGIYLLSSLKSIKNIDETKFNERNIKDGILGEIKMATFFNCENYVDYRFDDYKRIKEDFKYFFEKYFYTNKLKDISYNEIISLVSSLNKDLLLYDIKPINIDLTDYLLETSKVPLNSAKVILERYNDFELYFFADLFNSFNNLEKLKIYSSEKNKDNYKFTGFLLDEYLSNKEEISNHIKMMRY